jgi:hypothetical protein
MLFVSKNACTGLLHGPIAGSERKAGHFPLVRRMKGKAGCDVGSTHREIFNLKIVAAD